MATVSLEKLLETGAHFGHTVRRWNPKMNEYIFGEREGVHIFDLIKTKEALEEGLDALAATVKEGKTVLLLGTKKQIKDEIKKVGVEIGVPYVDERWLGGMLTNFGQMKRSTKLLAEMKEKTAAGDYKHLTKKERLMKARAIEKMDRKFGGVSELTQTPDFMVVFDTKREHGAIMEANQLGIPVLGITDTNADPTIVTYPVPMNDDASAALEYILELVKDTIVSNTPKAAPVKKEKEETKIATQ